MEKLPIALQLYSVRDAMEADFTGTLKKVKEMGYDGVEFAGLFDHGAQEIKELLGRIGLTPISAHVPYADMAADPEKVLGEYAEIGCRYVAVPYLTEQYRPGTDEFPKVVETIAMLGKVARRKGMTLLYHNHDFEFVKVGNEYGLDVLYSRVPADLLQTELDTCWVNVAGEDPLKYLRKYSGRAPLVHLKDFVMKGKKKPAHMYALIGIPDEKGDAAEEESFGFRPVGYGVQDIPAIVKASAEAGAKWLVVEQDNPGPGKTSMESAEMSVRYLKAL